MKRLKFTAEEIDNRLDLVKTIKDAQTATGASVVQMQSVVDTVDKLAKGTDAAFKGFIAGSDLNLKTIDTSLATTKASLDALSGIKDWTAQQIEINKQQFDIALNDHKASIADHYATVAGVKTIETSLDLVNKALGSVDEITNTAGEVVGYQAESIKAVADSVDLVKADHDLAMAQFEVTNKSLDTVQKALGSIKEITDEAGHITGYQADAIKAVSEAGLEQAKAAKEYTDAQIEVTNSAVNLVQNALGKIEVIGQGAEGVTKYQVEAIKAVSDAGLAQAQAAKAYTDEQINITNSSVTAVKNIVDEIAEISDSSGEIAHYQAKGIQALNDAINAEGTGLVALKEAVDAAQDAANTNKTAFETFYKTDEKGEVLPETVFGTFKTMVDEHDAAMKDTETGLTALHSAIGAVKTTTTTQAGLIKGHTETLAGFENTLKGFKGNLQQQNELINKNAKAIGLCVTTAKFNADFAAEHTKVADAVTNAQQTVSDEVAKVGVELAKIGTTVADQMEIAFGNTPEANDNVKRIREAALNAERHATSATTTADEAKQEATRLNGEVEKANKAIVEARGHADALKKQVDDDIKSINDSYTQVNKDLTETTTKLTKINNDLQGDGTPENPGVIKTVQNAQQIVNTAQNDIEKAKTDIEGINTELTKKQEAIEAAEGRLNTAEGTLNGLDARFAAVNSNISNAQGRVDGLVKQLSGDKDNPDATEDEKLGILGKVQAAEAAITKANKDIKDNKDALDADINKFKEQLNGKEGQPGLLAQVATAGEKVDAADKLLNGDKESTDPELQKGILAKVAQAQKDIEDANHNISENKKAFDTSVADFNKKLNGDGTSDNPGILKQVSDAKVSIEKADKLLNGDETSEDPELKKGILARVEEAQSDIAEAANQITINKNNFDKDIDTFKKQLNGDKEKDPNDTGLLGKVDLATAKVEKADKLLNGDESSKDPELQKGILVRVEEAQSDIAEANRQIGTNKQELTNSINDFKVQVNGTGEEGDPEETRLGLIGMANQAIKTANGKITEMEGSITTANNTLTTLGSRIEEVNNTLLPKINKLTGDAEQLAADNKKTAEDLTATAADIRANANIIKGVADKAAQDIADGNLHIAKGSISLGGTAQSPAFKVDESGKLLATSGKIAGFNIVGNELSSQTVSLNPTKGITLTLSSNQSENEGLYITANETTASVKSLHDLRLTNDKLLVTNYSNSAGKIEGFTIESIKSDYPSISSSIVLNSDKNRRGIELFTTNSDVSEHAELTVGPNSYRTDIVCSTGIFRDKDGPIDSKSLHSALQYSGWAAEGVVFKSGEIVVPGTSFKTVSAPTGASSVLSVSTTLKCHDDAKGYKYPALYKVNGTSVEIGNNNSGQFTISYFIVYKK